MTRRWTLRSTAWAKQHDIISVHGSVIRHSSTSSSTIELVRSPVVSLFAVRDEWVAVIVLTFVVTYCYCSTERPVSNFSFQWTIIITINLTYHSFTESQFHMTSIRERRKERRYECLALSCWLFMPFENIDIRHHARQKIDHYAPTKKVTPKYKAQ